MLAYLDLSRTVHPLLHRFSLPSLEQAERICRVALPFVNFHPPIGRSIELGMGTINILSLSVDTIHKRGKLTSSEIKKRSVELARTTAMVALSIISPQYVHAASYGYLTIVLTKQFSEQIKNKEYKQALNILKQALVNTVQLLASLYGGSALLSLSFIIHTTKAFVKAYEEGERHHYLEMGAEFLLGVIYAFQSSKQLQLAYRDYVITPKLQKQWDEIALEIAKDRDRLIKEEEQKIQQESIGEVVPLEQKGFSKPPCSIAEEIPIQNNSPLEECFSKEHLKQFIKKSNRELNKTMFCLNIGRLRLKLSDYIEKRGLSKHVVGIKFDERFDFYYVDFKGFRFERCQFINSDIQYSRFIQSVFQKCHWKNCSIYESEFNSCQFEQNFLKNVTFESVTIDQCTFQDTWFNHVFFVKVQMTALRFFRSSINVCLITLSKLNNIVIKQSEVLKAFAEQFKERITFSDCSLMNLTKPIISLGTQFGRRGLFGTFIERVLTYFGADVLVYNYYWGEASSLQTQVEELRKQYVQSEESIAQWILNQAPEDSPIGRVKEMAREIVALSHGSIIPGGGHVAEGFYNPTKSFDGNNDSNFENLNREILELAIVQESVKQKKEVIGVCRGSQLINVFFGGTLQNTDKGHGFQHLELVSDVDAKVSELFGVIVSDFYQFVAYSCHHQAADKLGEGIKRVFDYKGCLKAFVHKSEHVLGLQFHPEVAIHLLEKDVIKKLKSNISKVFQAIMSLIQVGQYLKDGTRFEILEYFQEQLTMLEFDPQDNLNIFERFVNRALARMRAVSA